MDRDALVAVAEDLVYLGTWGSDISDAEIRRGSAVLRRLLIEDAYGAAWRAIGTAKEPQLIAVDLDHMIANRSTTDVELAIAAGVEFRGVKMACILIDRGPPPGPSPYPGADESTYPGSRNFFLAEYLGSLSGRVGPHSFTRRDVIKYIANVKGGVHLNSQQRKQEEKLIARVEKIERRVAVHRTDGLLVELVAIGQAVGRSADAKEFIAAVLR
ncbi:MAG: hypothetical protein ACXWBT_18825 [Usitatibacter sp.]